MKIETEGYLRKHVDYLLYLDKEDFESLKKSNTPYKWEAAIWEGPLLGYAIILKEKVNTYTALSIGKNIGRLQA